MRKTDGGFIEALAGPDGDTWALRGAWELVSLDGIWAEAKTHRAQSSRQVTFDGSELEALDTAGALLVFRFAELLGAGLDDIEFRNLAPKHARIAMLVHKHLAKRSRPPESPPLGYLARVGRRFTASLRSLVALISFLGQTLASLLSTILRPRTFRVQELLVQLQRVAVEAVPITCLVMILIGIVVAYLLAAEIQPYGAGIYLVDGVSITICRELSPIIVAIIIAGRSGSAFTAQLGAMKLNDEIDAISTLGLQPMKVLVVPRVLALVLALPLLVGLGNIMGIFGGLLVGSEYLGLSPRVFTDRLQQVLETRHVLVGLVKAPVFASVIAIIGCQMGLSVEKSARSIGLHTTSTVVQAVVAVILLDAGFAVFFEEIGF